MVIENKHTPWLNPITTLFVAVCLVQISACDLLTDCLDADGPQFENDSIADPTLNQVYTGRIRASVKNEPFDDRFDYRFKLTGQLPTGLDTRSEGRSFIIEGTATELGTYYFDLFVEIDDGLSAEDSGLCYTTRTQEFQFTVQQQN